MEASQIKALTLDVFGTVVDWRGSIIREGERLGLSKGLRVDWAGFADQWRAQYHPSIARVRNGELPWTNVDTLHRWALDRLLVEFGLGGLSEEEKVDLNCVWHRLDPWADTVEGLTILRRRFLLCTLSNASFPLLVNMAKRASLPWDAILCSELLRAYKPDADAYLRAIELLALRPDQVLMVAAHQYDLRAARASGLRTAFVLRPLEYGPENPPNLTPDPDFDLVATDFTDLARQLGL